jgi:homoserine O-succinyltransferase/O-acetyltransferase
MPLFIDGGRIPPRWAEAHSLRTAGHLGAGAECLRVALINNMPDPALEDTEMQFMQLLDDASGGVPVTLKLYSLPGVPRGERGVNHLSNFYYGIEELWHSGVDAIIVTGTEPRQPNLRQEPYWCELADVFDWAAHNTASAILSCLAAHAAALHGDGIPRQPLADKRFGVFDSAAVCDHPIMRRLRGSTMQRSTKFPHSRWNEVREDALAACGYSILTLSDLAGVDLFVKERENSLFVCFQGHPEYAAHTLLKEYRRDIKRFLRRERETYPTMPYGYFDASSAVLLNNFQQIAVADRNEERMASFPEAAVSAAMRHTWKSSAIEIYRNWLQYVLAKKTAVRAFAVVAASFAQLERKKSAVS